ncbi:hypothetical protein CCE02nite_25070 [Cellulosimicrobium cellulans]|uniref:Uncharacterized protein n=1 Tax=Cellulosimicrobium cellulans TaxID=1710 RepID=A0A4Y4E4N2_CELCE|nr:hypothetical protein CCE02nite_25070 [Cellulosimicrobium cellulans]
MRADGDEHLTRPGDGVGDLVEDEVLGRSERVQADGVHGCSLGCCGPRPERRYATRSGRALLVSNLNKC